MQRHIFYNQVLIISTVLATKDIVVQMMGVYINLHFARSMHPQYV